MLLDVLMPGLDGYATCARIRADHRTAMLPVVMVTASGTQQRLRALEVGADDFIAKPFDQAELVARVRSLARVKRLHDTVVEQRAALERWNAELERRVAAQVEDLERLGRLRRFLSPQIAGLIVETGDESFLESHRRDITTVFTDLRGFTAFAETAEPEETMAVLRDYHAALGALVFAYEGTLEHFAGDGLMVFFNDPPPCPDAPARAVRMALDMRAHVDDLARVLAPPRARLGFGVGIAQGYATLGRVGLRGTLGLRRDRHRHQRRRATLRRRPRPARSSSAPGARRTRRPLRDALARTARAARHLAAPRGPRGHRDRRHGPAAVAWT